MKILFIELKTFLPGEQTIIDFLFIILSYYQYDYPLGNINFVNFVLKNHFELKLTIGVNFFAIMQRSYNNLINDLVELRPIRKRVLTPCTLNLRN